MLTLVLMSCEDPIELEIADGPDRLVVEGWLSNEPGPYQLTLSFTTNFNDTNINPPVVGAEVEVIDGNGEIYRYLDQGSGLYISTEQFQSSIGETYYCRILIPDGRLIESNPETLLPVPIIDSLFYKEVFPPAIIEGIIQEEFFWVRK